MKEIKNKRKGKGRRWNPFFYMLLISKDARIILNQGRMALFRSHNMPGEQGCRKHLKLGGHDTLRALFRKKMGAFSKNKEGTSLFIAKSLANSR